MISKKLAIIIAAVALFLSATLSYLYFSNSSVISKLGYQAPTDELVSGGDITSGPKIEVCPLNGELKTRAQKKLWEKRRPMGVMIENSLDARPQSGLSDADIIYETVAEGGITRFMAMYYCQDATIIGPVRSARIYFVNLLQEYGDYPLYAHVGGANTPGPADALGEIADLDWDGYNDLNQFAVPFPYYYRDYERLPERATEHTMYASTAKLWDYAKKQRELTNKDEDGNEWDENFTPWKFADEAKPEERDNVSKISFDFWPQFGSTYSVVWNYDKTSNTYARVNGGKAHTDKNNGKTLTAKNVFVVFSDESSANDGYPGGHLLYDLTGSGDGVFFQNGKAIKGKWQKKDPKTRMKFVDQSGRELSIVRGKVFVEILPTGNEVEY